MWRYSETSLGTTDETASPSIWSNPIPRSASRLCITTASSSPVDWRSVENRQCSTSSAPSKAPTWVWVLPTSMVSSMGRDYLLDQRADALHALTRRQPLQGNTQLFGVRRLQLEQRNQHEP